MNKISITKTLLIILILGNLLFCKNSQEEISKSKEQWDAADSKTFFTWSQAVEYCKGKQMRLPTLREIKDASKIGLGREWQGSVYWSSDEIKDAPRYVYAFSLTSKDSFETDKTGLKDTHCIR
ncbi:MAG: hypothetical protein KA146_07195 [Leptospiraceae bacterium]|nr:hypothetical protein [Leptospiraceae bacterium]